MGQKSLKGFFKTGGWLKGWLRGFLNSLKYITSHLLHTVQCKILAGENFDEFDKFC